MSETNLLLVLQIKLSNNLVKKFVYYLQMQARMFPGRKITMIFDMQETGLAQMV